MKSIQWYKSLSMQKYRRQHGCFLIEGARAVDQVITYYNVHVEEILCVDDFDLSAITSLLSQKKISVRKISSANMKTICTSKTPQGIAALVRIPDDVYSSTLPQIFSGNFSENLSQNCNDSNNHNNTNYNSTILLLEDIQDPGNVGTLIRTAAAFGVSGVILSDKCADPFSPKVVQSTAGSLLSIWIRKSDEYLTTINELRQNHAYKLIAADVDGDDIKKFASDKNHNDNTKKIIALGNEGAGLSEEIFKLCDYRVSIPINTNGAESLNVAVSGGIFLYMLC